MESLATPRHLFLPHVFNLPNSQARKAHLKQRVVRRGFIYAAKNYFLFYPLYAMRCTLLSFCVLNFHTRTMA